MAAEGPLRIMLVEDHDSFRQALTFLFQRHPEFEVVAQAKTLTEARMVLGEPLDVAVVDLVLPDGDGVEIIPEFRRANPDGLVLVLSASLEPRRFSRAVEAGADGVLDKLASVAEIMDAVRRLRAGEVIFGQGVSAMLRLYVERAKGAAPEDLTGEEAEALRALAGGLDDEGVASRLGVSREEARSLVEEAVKKLGASSRLQALALAARAGILSA